MTEHQHTLPPDRFRLAAAHNLRVFPALPRSKKAALKWTKYQTEAPTADDLARWDASDSNVCVVTGTPDGVVVLDVDSEQGQQVVDNELDLPPTATVRTARGRHYYFRSPPQEVRNTVNVKGVKLDFRGTGGYVIGAGSIHPDGSLYDWEKSPAEVGIAPFPEQLLTLLETKKRPSHGSGSSRSNPKIATGLNQAGVGVFVERALRGALNAIDEAPDGQRNDTLFKVSARMARYVAAANAEWSPVAVALGDSARSAGLEDEEIERTLESGWNAGRTEPTPWIRAAVEYVYLANQDCFYHLASGRDLKRVGFNGQHGHEFEDKDFAGFLLNEGYIRKVFDLTYEPLDSRRLIPRNGLEYLNTFRPSDVTAVEGDPAPFVDFMEGLVPEEDERVHLIKMIAFTVRNPGQKLRYALLFRSAIQGVGKSMLASIWGGLLGSHNVRKTTPKEIFSDFQSYLPEKLLVVCEEMNLGMGTKAYNDLKDILTSNTALINEKYMKQREWPVYATMVFYTNLEKPILIEPTDRRIFFIDSSAKKREPAYYRGFVAWWESNLGVIRGYLDNVDLEGFDPQQAPPMTAAKLALIEGSKSESAQDLQWMIKEREGFFDRDLVTLDEVGYQVQRKCSARQLSNALKEVGAVSLGQQRVGTRRVSLWAIRNADYWRLASGDARLQELTSQGGGIFAFLDGTDVEVVHIASQRDAGKLVAGFEEAFGLPATVG